MADECSSTGSGRAASRKRRRGSTRGKRRWPLQPGCAYGSAMTRSAGPNSKSATKPSCASASRNWPRSRKAARASPSCTARRTRSTTTRSCSRRFSRSCKRQEENAPGASCRPLEKFSGKRDLAERGCAQVFREAKRLRSGHERHEREDAGINDMFLDDVAVGRLRERVVREIVEDHEREPGPRCRPREYSQEQRGADERDPPRV